MIGIDTNILVRWLVDDPAVPEQSDRARDLIEGLGDKVMIAVPVIAETVWLARGTFGLRKPEIVAMLTALLGSPGLVIAERAAVERALASYRTSRADFVDCLIATLNRDAGCTTTLTFDKTAAKDADFSLLT